MALRIRCSQCQKKISVDEAFAGSMCRCPYCKMIIRVPRAPESGPAGHPRPSRPGTRPERPSQPQARPHVGSGLQNVAGSRPIVDGADKARPSRPTRPTVIEKPGVPQVPGYTPEPKPVHRPQPVPVGESAQAGSEKEIQQSAPVDETQLTAEQIAAIPIANTVFLQGMVSLILIGVLVVVGAASVYLGMKVFAKASENQSDTAYVSGEEPETVEELPNPFLVSEKGPRICSVVEIADPVVYVIDGGDAMGDLFLYARDAMRASAISLGDGASFGVIVAGEERDVYVGSKMFQGGSMGDKAIQPFLRSNYDDDPTRAVVEIGGASDLKRGVDQALSLKPKTLVLFVRNTDIPDPKDLGKRIASGKVRLVLVAFGYEYDEQKQSYEALVKAAGAAAKLVLYDTDRELQTYYDERNLPE